MSDQVSKSDQNAALQANLQMNDLGDVNRNRVFTADPGHREVNVRRVLATRECNDQESQAYKLSEGNNVKISAWSNPLRFLDPEADYDEDDDFISGVPVNGQSHRVRLNAEKRAGNLTEDFGPPQTSRYAGSKHKGKHHTKATDLAPAKKQSDPPSRNNVNGNGPTFNNNQQRLVNRPHLQPKSRASGPKPDIHIPASQHPQKKVTQSRGESSTTRAPYDHVYGRLTPPTSEPFSKKRQISHTLPPVNESEHKRQLKYTSEPPKKQNDQQSSAQKRGPSRVVNAGPSRVVEAGSHQDGHKVAPKVQAPCQSSKQTSSTPIKAAGRVYNIQPHWKAPLNENKVVVPVLRTLADLSTDDMLRQHPSTARFFDQEPSKESSTQSNSVTSIVIPQEPAVRLRSIKAATVDANKGMERITVDMEAMTLSSQPQAPATTKPGLAASKYATLSSPAGSIISRTPAVDSTKQEYDQAMSSEPAFWAWKALQTTKRDGL